MELLTSKIVSMLLLGGISLALGVVPLAFRRCIANRKKSSSETSKWNIFVSCLNCIGAGVILATAITHMLPEVNVFVKNNVASGAIPDTGLPLAEIFTLCGFYMVYLVEEIVHFCVSSCSREIDEVDAKMASTDENLGMMTHHDSHGHAHNIELQKANNSCEAAFRSFLVVLALSLHAVFEGIALGLTGTSSSVWFLFFAVASHKFVISFCIGLQFVSSGLNACLVILYVATFALISPLGAGIGILLSEWNTSESSLQTATITGLATGTLLYVVFFEVLEKERAKGTNGLIQVTFSILGSLCMLGLELMEMASLEHFEMNFSNGTDPNSNNALLQPMPNHAYCQMLTFSVNWVLPKNFTCEDGVLVPL